MESNRRNTDYRWRGNIEATPAGRKLGGLVIISVGLALLARQIGVELPEWLFTWEMLLIAIGVFQILKSTFRRWAGGLTLIIIGGIFLVNHLYPEIRLAVILWPAILIIFGLVFMFGGSRRRRARRISEARDAEPVYSDEVIDIVTIFGGTKKNIITKNLKGGEVVIVFGGAEINLTQSEILSEARLEITQVFGGTKLIVPSHWRIRSELTAIAGGIDDKRAIVPQDENAPLLILEGTAVFAGIDIRTY